jgi:hypothetical protein
VAPVPTKTLIFDSRKFLNELRNRWIVARV